MKTATVEVLTAEVRVLMVGKRQVTLSVYRQLDVVPPGEIVPFGRVRDPKEPTVVGVKYKLYADRITVVGAGPDGELCRSVYDLPNEARLRDLIRAEREILDGRLYPQEARERAQEAIRVAERCIAVLGNDAGHDWHELPLIVLAGLT